MLHLLKTTARHAKLSLTFGFVLAGSALANDLTTLSLADGGLQYWGESAGVAGYSMMFSACNAGNVPLTWTGSEHPVVGQNLYRLHDGRFEQIGQSWVFHEFCAINEAGCGACQSTGCSTLGVGCASSHSALLTDGQAGGPKSDVQAASGAHLDTATQPTGPPEIRGRLQVALSDLDPALFPGALYFVEVQYIAAQDAAAGAAWNNVSWRQVQVNSPQQIVPVGQAHVGESVLYAWAENDPAVIVAEVQNLDEAGPGRHGLFTVAHRVTELAGSWRYDWVLHNQCSSASARALRVDWDPVWSVLATEFNDVDYHSGEPYDGTDWTASTSGNTLEFACGQSHAQNPNANALRWGTAYSLRLETQSAPRPGVGVLELFAPIGPATSLSFPCAMPSGGVSGGTPFCFGDGSTAACPCTNGGLAGEGCLNSQARGAQLTASGTASIAISNLGLHAIAAAPQQFGVFVQGGSEIANPFRDGLLCAGNPKLRLETSQLDVTGGASSSVVLASSPGVNAGATMIYQLWYRDPLGPCGTGSNLSNALRLTWTP